MEEEVFEIVDFTSASEWELFTSKLEEIILSWQLPLKEDDQVRQHINLNGKWKSSSEDISFAGFPFIVTYHWVEDPLRSEEGGEAKGIQVFASLTDSKNDFPVAGHSLAYFYGLGEFLVIAPAGNETLDTESRINLVLSSITIAVNSTQCRAPVFVQGHSKTQQFYLGTFESKNLRTNFEMVHLKRTPVQCTHLTGLVNVFKEKIGPKCRGPVDISVCWTYVLAEDDPLELSSTDNWPQAPPDFDHLHGAVGVSSLSQLSSGATKDPIKEIRIGSIWNSLNEDVVVDSEVYTDLDATQAPLWVAQVELNDNVPSLLYKSLTSFLDSCRSTQTTEFLLGKNYTVLQSPDSPEYGAALGALTNQRSYPLLSPKNSRLPWQASEKKAGGSGPIAEAMLVKLLNYLFPDAEGENSNHPYPPSFDSDLPSNLQEDPTWKECFSGLKSAPVDCLVYRLAVAMVYTNTHLGGIEGVAHLWHEIVLELRFRWENNILIPGLDRGVPDLNYSRIYQKLQMLNCCINHSKSRSAVASAAPAAVEVAEEDEFFDAVEEALDVDVEDSVPKSPPSDSARHSAWNQPQGRKERSKLKLLNCPDETIYVPFTQEPLPMTEDALEEMESMLSQLGSDAEGSELRARLMSALLFSDMEAFKAANPGAVMADFVRWHSPRDWIDEETTAADGSKTAGQLSQRMLLSSNNLWREMWESSKPVPARRQRRLFDDTKEAEKILHSFAAMKPADVAVLLLPVVFHAAIYRLLEQFVAGLEDVARDCRSAVSRLVQIARHTPLQIDQYKDVLPLLRCSEVHLSQYKSLRQRMSVRSDSTPWDGLDQFVVRLLNQRHVPLAGGAHSTAGAILLKTLQQQTTTGETKSAMATPSIKEFILRASSSMEACQKMYCRIDNSKNAVSSFRLAGAFTQDIMFY